MTPLITATDAERVLAGSVLYDSDTLDDVRGIVQSEDFADYPTRLVYETAVHLRDVGRPVTAESVLLELIQRGQAADLGDKPALFLADLLSLAPTAANATFAAGKVRDAAIRRHATHIALELIRDAASPTGPADELIETFLKRLSAVAEDHTSDDESETIGVALIRAGQRYDALARGEGPQPIPTGFDEVDRVLCGGCRPGEFVLIGARPGGGKSVLLRQCAVSAAELGIPTILFGMEMPTDQTVDRIVADKAAVPLARLRGSSRMTQDQVDRIIGLTAADGLAGKPLILDERKRLTVAQIATKARRLVRKKGVKLIAVDYLQLLQPEDRRAKRYEQIGQISRDLKILAVDLNVVVMAAVQVNRDASGGAPQLHQLRESGSLEQDGDIVLLLHALTSDPNHPLQDYELNIAKQRNGLPGVKVNLQFARFYTRLEPAGIPL